MCKTNCWECLRNLKKGKYTNYIALALISNSKKQMKYCEIISYIEENFSNKLKNKKSFKVKIIFF